MIQIQCNTHYVTRKSFEISINTEFYAFVLYIFKVIM